MTIRPLNRPELPDFDARWLTPGAQSVGRARADIGCRSVVELKTAVCVRFWPLGDKRLWPWLGASRRRPLAFADLLQCR